AEEGIERAKEELYKRVDNRTVLFLSGGQTPLPLYRLLAFEEIIKPAVVGLVDERYGKSLHDDSNELLIKGTGLLDYLEKQKIPFYPMLGNDVDITQAAQQYDKKTRDLFFQFPKSIAVTGIGKDGHTAGIAPNRTDFTNPLFNTNQNDLYVAHFDDEKGPFKKRVTMTFNGLALIDFFIVLAFGQEKAEALRKVFIQGDLEEIPARFYQQPDIVGKTLFITDQNIL
ncbi:MAG: 6-phosphogluconolactonase, partial [Candidatus Levyibacteriota bacterium]